MVAWYLTVYYCFRLFESFFFSHITLIESHVVKLRLAVEKALQKRNKHMVTEVIYIKYYIKHMI